MKKFLFSSLAALLVMLALPVAGVFAASVTSQGQKNNCVEQISPLRAGQVSSSVLSIKCFATFSQSIAYSTNGAIRLPATASPRDLTASMMRSASVRPHIVLLLGILYSDINDTGSSSLSVYTGSTGTACSGVANYGISDLGVYSWDNTAQSLLGDQNSCNFTTLYSGTSYSGTPSECFTGVHINTLDQVSQLSESVIWGSKDPTVAAGNNSPHPPSVTSCKVFS